MQIQTKVEVVFDQRQQRHHYDSHSLVSNCRELEGQTLATACRDEGQHVFPRFSRVDNLSLVLSERFILEHLLVAHVNLQVPWEGLLPLRSLVRAVCSSWHVLI